VGESGVRKVTAAMSELASLYVQAAFEAKEAGDLPLFFSMDVLQRYAQDGVRLMRSHNAGRLQSKEGWRLDFGIVDEARLIHAPAREVFRLPKAERLHFAAHLHLPPLNERFLRLQMGGGACVDDGETQPWDGTPRAAVSRD